MTTNDLIVEVEESIRRERLGKLWKDYGPGLIGGAALAVLLTGAFSGYNAWRSATDAKQTAVLMRALEAPDKTGALANAAEQLSGGPAAVAGLTAAGLLLRDGKRDEALARFEAISKDSAVPGTYRDLAALMAVKLDWGRDTKDAAKTDGFLERLKPLWSAGSSPWRFHAHIQAALIHAHDLKDYTKAREHLAAVLAQDGLPTTLTERAQALDHVYALSEAKEKRPEANTQTPDDKQKPEG